MKNLSKHRQPFFILGNPRSGTSLLRLMLNSHPEITVPPECGFLLWLSEKYVSLENYNEKIYSQFVDDLFKTRKIETWGMQKNDLLKLINKEKPKSYTDMAALVYSHYAQKKGKNNLIYGDKNNYYINETTKIKKLYPQSKSIFIVRDGRDVAASYLSIAKKNIDSKYKPKLSSSIPEIALQWKKSTLNANKQLDNPASCIIRYEDLVRDPATTLEKACKHIGSSYTKEMLNFHLKNDEPTEFLQWKEKTKNPIDSTSISKYKKELTKEQVTSFESYAYEALKAFHYTE